MAEASVLWPPDVNNWFIGKDPSAGKDWRQKEKKVRELDGHESMDMNLGKLWERVRDREAWHAAVRGVTKSCTWLGNWTTTKLLSWGLILLLLFQRNKLHILSCPSWLLAKKKKKKNHSMLSEKHFGSIQDSTDARIIVTILLSPRRPSLMWPVQEAREHYRLWSLSATGQLS